MNKKVIQSSHIVEMKDAGRRLDVLVSEFFGLTRSAAKKAVDEGIVTVNGRILRPKDTAKDGDLVALLQIEKDKTNVKVPVVYEDDDILVIDKPSGISVHPAAGEKDMTLVEIFAEKLSDFNDRERPGVVHRLDKGTSGVMILAKNQTALEKLKNEFKKRNVKKIYNALVWGHVIPKEGIIDMPISRGTVLRQKFEIDKAGREAVTEYSTVKVYKELALLDLKPKTGRTHQIRVHLSALGYPIVGDKKYGRKNDPIDRIFLHAKKISFRHPKTEKMMTFESNMPDELQEFLNKLV